MPDTEYTRLTWDEPGERYFEAGADRGVVYLMNPDGTYETGEAWNGLTGVEDNPEGADLKEFYANNNLYASFRGVEKEKGTIKAYTYPDAFAECDGSKELVTGSGVFARQQKRRPFGFTYRNHIGEGEDFEGVKAIDGTDREHYVIHIVYGATVDPSSKTHDTINEDPDLEEMSWEYTASPVKLTEATGFRPMGSIEIDSHKISAAKLEKIENALYGKTGTGSAGNAPHILLPDDIYTILTTNG